MQIGDVVLVKTFLGQPIKRRVCGIDNGSVKICTEDHFQSGESNGTEIPREQVFKWDESLFHKMLEFDGYIDDKPPELSKLWEKAKSYYK